MKASDAELLVADIGATNARFARCVGNVSQASVVFPSAAERDAPSLVARACVELGMGRVEACCIAVAGPVTDAGVGGLTNQGLVFDQAEIAEVLDLRFCTVVNDLVAMAEGTFSLQADHVRQIGGDANRNGARAVIAPGTGLGMAFLIPLGDRIECIPSEGGHGPFAPADPLEQEVLSVLATRGDGYVSWESVLSGPGLVNLYGAVSSVWGSEPGPMTAEEIAVQGADLDDPVCHQTLGMFCAVLGSAAGMLAITACAEGGVYIGGGIVPHIVDFLEQSGFRRRFEERGVLRDYVASIPVRVIMDEQVALAGAARRALRLLEDDRHLD